MNRLDKYGWPDIWHPDKDSWFVGVWHTNFDLLCVRRCETEEEAEKWLSPEGHSFLEAIDKAEKLLKTLST